MKVYASISGGKDSLAALITHMEHGGQCDGAIYCRIMFDDETSAEVPEHEEWLHSKCFPLLEREAEWWSYDRCRLYPHLRGVRARRYGAVGERHYLLSVLCSRQMQGARRRRETL